MSRTFTELRVHAAPKSQRYTLGGATMGTRYSAVFYAPPGFATDALAGALFAAVDEVDRQMSLWLAHSDLNRLNRAPVGSWIVVPDELHEVLRTALDVEQASGGAFNVAVGNAVRAWGFGPPGGESTAEHSPTGRCPRPSIDLELEPRRVRKHVAMTLDLDGIAKGYGVDRMAAVMHRFALTSWLVGIDGELRAEGRKPDGSAWAVGHERPDRSAREPMGVIELSDVAVATSGSYRHWREVAGETVSHTMDPDSGRPLRNVIASATVLAPTCIEADAWATALMVLGPAAAAPMLVARGLEWIAVCDDGTLTSSL